MKKGALLNDFEAAAYGLLETKKGTFYNVTGCERKPNERMFILGAGTGLGECLLVPKPSLLDVS
jgi:glucokinase